MQGRGRKKREAAKRARYNGWREHLSHCADKRKAVLKEQRAAGAHFARTPSSQLQSRSLAPASSIVMQRAEACPLPADGATCSLET